MAVPVALVAAACFNSSNSKQQLANGNRLEDLTDEDEDIEELSLDDDQHLQQVSRIKSHTWMFKLLSCTLTGWYAQPLMLLVLMLLVLVLLVLMLLVLVLLVLMG